MILRSPTVSPNIGIESNVITMGAANIIVVVKVSGKYCKALKLNTVLPKRKSDRMICNIGLFDLKAVKPCLGT